MRVVDASPIDDYVDGHEYLVDVVDPTDGTFRGRDPVTGSLGGWLRWRQVESVADTIGFEFLKQHLSAQTVELLKAFDGVEALRLKPDIRDRILLGLPDLERLVRAEAEDLTRPGPKLRRRSAERARAARGPEPEPELELDELLEEAERAAEEDDDEVGLDADGADEGARRRLAAEVGS